VLKESLKHAAAILPAFLIKTIANAGTFYITLYKPNFLQLLKVLRGWPSALLRLASSFWAGVNISLLVIPIYREITMSKVILKDSYIILM